MADREHLQLRLAVDLAILTVRENQLNVLVIERGHEPFRGQGGAAGRLPAGWTRTCATRPSANWPRKPASTATACIWSSWPPTATPAATRAAG